MPCRFSPCVPTGHPPSPQILSIVYFKVIPSFIKRLGSARHCARHWQCKNEIGLPPGSCCGRWQNTNTSANKCHVIWAIMLCLLFYLQRLEHIRCSNLNKWIHECINKMHRGCLAISGRSLDGNWAQAMLENLPGRTVIRAEPWRTCNLAQPCLIPVFSVLLLYPFPPKIDLLCKPASDCMQSPL